MSVQRRAVFRGTPRTLASVAVVHSRAFVHRFGVTAYRSRLRAPTIVLVPELEVLLVAQGNVATTEQLRRFLTRRGLEAKVDSGDLTRVWSGVYGSGDVDDRMRLRGLDLRAGVPVPICLGTAARAYGFDTEDVIDLHVLNPERGQLRDADGLVVHRRDGAPLAWVEDRPATSPAWTAVEVARGLTRPRALATLDAALRSRTCDRRELLRAAAAQWGRRGIVKVRELIPLAAAEAESPMESESRLLMYDGGLPSPELQFEVVDRDGRRWRLDFAWPEQKLAVEYDGFDFHGDPAALRHDRQKRAALAELDWRVMSIVSDDVRRAPRQTVRRIEVELARVEAA